MTVGRAKGIATHVLVTLGMLAPSVSPVKAQATPSQDAIGALGNLFGTLAQAEAKSNALKQWKSQDPTVVQCVNTVFSGKGITTDNIAAAGVGPADQRVSPVIALCQAALTTQLKTNFQCTVTTERGQRVGSTCDESYVVVRKGLPIAVSRDDFLRAAGNGETVDVKPLETGIARTKRVRAERELPANTGHAFGSGSADQDSGEALNESYRQEWLRKVGTISTRIQTPKGLAGAFRLIDKNANVEEFIGSPSYKEDGVFSIVILSIPDNVRMFAPMYNFQKKQGYTIDASATHAKYMVDCRSRIYTTLEVQYLIGGGGVYKNLISYYPNNPVYDANVIFRNLQLYFFRKMSLDKIDFRSIELKRFCK